MSAAEHTGQPPTDHEMACPACGATIRSRLADHADAAELARLRRQRAAVLTLADELPDIVRDQALHSRPAATWDTVAHHIAGRLREIVRETRGTSV